MARRKTTVTVEKKHEDGIWKSLLGTDGIPEFKSLAQAHSWLKLQKDSPGRYRIIRVLAEVELRVTTVEKVEVV